MPLPKLLPNISNPKQVAEYPGGGEVATASKKGPDNGRGGGAGRRGRVIANRYAVENKLGSGAFGIVFLVTDLKSKKDRKVLKQIGVAELQPGETVDAVREARLLAKLEHPYIVKFHDSFMDSTDFFCIITEFCEGGDLDAKIVQWRERGERFEESLIVDWFIQLTTAIKYIHERRVLHRDLKTRNIFLKNNLIKLGDFGISRILMGTSDLATTFTGTPYYMSPEVLKHDGYNSKSDIWSLACVLYELCTLKHAFQGQNLMAVMYKIVEGEKPRLPDHFSTELKSLFLKMLMKDPNQRPSAVEILREHFIQHRLQKVRGKMFPKAAVTTSERVAREAEAIAQALNPVKKSLLVHEDPALTPRQRVELRKKQRADKEAERIKLEAAQNYNEGRKRFKEHKKKQTRVVPPWVAEHPDVFSDPNFSISRLDTPVSDSNEAVFTELAMSVDCERDNEKQEEERVLAWDVNMIHRTGDGGDGGGGDRIESVGSDDSSSARIDIGGGDFRIGSGSSGFGDDGGVLRGSSDHGDGGGVLGGSSDHGDGGGVLRGSSDHGDGGSDLRISSDCGNGTSLVLAQGRVEDQRDGNWPDLIGDDEDDMIPEDPLLAETHYSQYEDFEDDDSAEDEEDYDALLVCIEDALNLSDEKDDSQESSHDQSHDEISPFTPLARERRIAILKEQCLQIYGAQSFERVHDYLHRARCHATGADEGAIMMGLRHIVPNVRDCFLVDQLVFLEKQAEAMDSIQRQKS